MPRLSKEELQAVAIHIENLRNYPRGGKFDVLTISNLLDTIDALEREKAELLAAFTSSARNHHKLMGYISRRDAHPHKSTEECAIREFEECKNIDCVEARAAIQHAEASNG